MGVKTHAAWKKDVALIVSDVDCAAAVFTNNVVKAAPSMWTKAIWRTARPGPSWPTAATPTPALPRGEENAIKMCAAAAKAIGCRRRTCWLASTGVIGQTLKVQVIEEGMPALYEALEHSVEASDAAAHAIMTTDTVKKGSGRGDCHRRKDRPHGRHRQGLRHDPSQYGHHALLPHHRLRHFSEMIRAALLKEVVSKTFNRISVDGDTSTNDSCIVLANGLAGNPRRSRSRGRITRPSVEALMTLCTELARKMAADGEGAKHLITCTVTGAVDEKTAETVARSVISSTLTKAAIFGADANWGRVLCAMGYSGAEFDPEAVDVAFASAAGRSPCASRDGGLSFDEDLAKKILTEHDVRSASPWAPVGSGHLLGLRHHLRLHQDQRGLPHLTARPILYTTEGLIPMSSHAQQAQTLVEALPYIQKFTGKTIVVKYGGNAMISDELRQAVMSDIILLVPGWHPGGGGPRRRAGDQRDAEEARPRKSRFVDGLRYTDAETMDVVQSVLCGKVNKNLVAQLNRLGGRAIGLCGMDGQLFQAGAAGREVRPGGKDHRCEPGAGGKRPAQRLYPRGVHRGPGRGRGHRLQHQRGYRRRQAGGSRHGGRRS